MNARQRPRKVVSPTRTAALCAAAALAAGTPGCRETPQPNAIEDADNNDYVSISGTVAETRPKEFVLDYGSGQITVEMDGWQWYDDGHALLVNDEVIVYGFVDADFYQQRTIEASSVYAKNLGTQFYANGADEEDFPVVATWAPRPHVEVGGRVTRIGRGEFEIDAGTQRLKVDTRSMAYDPLDDEGFQKLAVGDRVRVTGDLELGLFSDRQLVADAVISIGSAKSEPSSS